MMSPLSTSTRAEIESFGPPAPKHLGETGLPATLLFELALKTVAALPNPTLETVAERLCLSWGLTEQLVDQLFRDKLIDVRSQVVSGRVRYTLLNNGRERLRQLQMHCNYAGPAPVTLEEYAHLMQLQARPLRAASMETVRNAFRDLVLPESLLQTLGCAINSRSSLFLTGLTGTGKTAIAERINGALFGFIWVPYALEIDGQIIRVFDPQCHRRVPEKTSAREHDRRWVEIERPLIIVGGELSLESTDLTWCESSGFYEAPFQLKSNGGTLVIDDLGRQRLALRDLLNRWIMPLERRADFLTLRNGRKIEVPFEQLLVFATDADLKDMIDEAFLRRISYRARVEPPSRAAYVEIFQRAAAQQGIVLKNGCPEYLLRKYSDEGRQMKSCEPRGLLDCVIEICLFEGGPPKVSPRLIDLAWRNYFGASHEFELGGAQAAVASVQI